MSPHQIALALAAWLAVATAAVANDDALTRAKDLYTSASYDEALAVLDTISKEAPADSAAEVAQYRLFCLLALNRADEARRAIEGIVAANPFYQLSDAQTSPRVRNVFQDTRRALLPGIVQQQYAEAKAAFERKDPKASERFDRLLELLDDPDLQKTAALTDLRTVATGFRDLSRATSVLPAQPALIVPLPRSPNVASAEASGAPAQIQAPRPASGDADSPPEKLIVTPASVISQPLPQWIPPSTPDSRRIFAGALVVTIDENGDVTSATIHDSIHPTYDIELLKMARTWKFKPAMKNGVPFTSTKVMEIRLRPGQ